MLLGLAFESFETSEKNFVGVCTIEKAVNENYFEMIGLVDGLVFTAARHKLSSNAQHIFLLHN